MEILKKNIINERRGTRTSVFQDNVKKMLERADQLQRGRISTHVVKAIFAANSDEQFAAAMKQLEGK